MEKLMRPQPQATRNTQSGRYSPIQGRAQELVIQYKMVSLKNIYISRVVVAHAFNTSTGEAKAGGSL